MCIRIQAPCPSQVDRSQQRWPSPGRLSHYSEGRSLATRYMPSGYVGIVGSCIPRENIAKVRIVVCDQRRFEVALGFGIVVHCDGCHFDLRFRLRIDFECRLTEIGTSVLF